jgi:hypothetical protein
MVFNATFNNVSPISWLSVLLETGVPGENEHYCRKSLTNFITSTPRHERSSNLQHMQLSIQLPYDYDVNNKVNNTVHNICNRIQEILEEVVSRFTVTQLISISKLQKTMREPQNISNIFSSSLYYSSESRMTHVLFTIVVFVWVQWGPTCVVLCLLGYSGVQLVLCCVFVLFSFVLCTPCYQFLWVVHFWLPLLYSLMFICLIVVLDEITNSSISISECVFSICKLNYLVQYGAFVVVIVW